jgi:hypothetical protein
MILKNLCTLTRVQIEITVNDQRTYNHRWDHLGVVHVENKIRYYADYQIPCKKSH